MASSRKSIYVAIAANIGIAIAKFVGFALTRSAAMLSEAIHSLVDCGNGALLLFGLHRSTKRPDQLHPFGYGKELYFWSLVVAVLIFVLGGGISIAEGVDHLRHPSASADATVAYIILLLSAAFEAYALLVSVKEFRASHPGKPLLESIRASKDPSSFTVLFEDAAALLGLLFAFAGIALGRAFGWPWADGAASVAIGLLLLLVSVLLIIECKALLVGEGADAVTLQAIEQIVLSDVDVIGCDRPMTMYFGPHTVLLTINVDFQPGVAGTRLKAAVERIEQLIKARLPEVQYIFIEFGRLPALHP